MILSRLRRPQKGIHVLKHSRLTLCLPVLCGLFLLSGCGYHLRGFSDSLPEDVETITVSPFVNETHEPDIETLLSVSLAEEFSKTRRLKVVYGEEADLVVSGTVRSFNNTPVSFSAADVAGEYRIEVSVDVTLKRRDNDDVLWKGKGLRESVDYQAVAGNVELTQANREDAKKSVAQELAELIYDRIFEGF